MSLKACVDLQQQGTRRYQCHVPTHHPPAAVKGVNRNMGQPWTHHLSLRLSFSARVRPEKTLSIGLATCGSSDQVGGGLC